MSMFTLWGSQKAYTGAAKQEPGKKGLEIIIGDPPIVIKYNGDRIGGIYKNKDVWEFSSANIYANSDTLRKIADKLDELNGVKS